MRRFPTLNSPMSGRRRWVAWALAWVAVASTTLVVSSATAPVAQSQRAAGAKESSGAKESPGTDLKAARAMALANARLRVESRQDAPFAHDRTADNSHADALFATHSWYVAPPPPPPTPPPPAPAPSAPPFPYTFVGAYTSQGDGTVYFLAQGDRVVDARVGDRLDGVYQFETATAGQLTFNYLPLNFRQLLSTGAPQ